MKDPTIIRVGVIGSSGVGKTCIVQRQNTGAFVRSPCQTIGVDFVSIEIPVFNPGNPWPVNVKLQIWDTAGHERFHCIARSYYRIVSGLVLCYDVEDEDTIEACRSSWMPDIMENCEDPIIIVAGCKAERGLDHVPQDSKIHPSIQEIMDKYPQNITEHIFCSARRNVNVEVLFRSIAQRVYDRVNPIAVLESEDESSTVNIHDKSDKSPQNRCCT